jgi:O-antigen/teichoic acid export membrane protein
MLQTAETTPETSLPVASHSRAKPVLAIAGRALGVLSAFLVTGVLARLLPDGSFGDFNMLLTILTPVSWWAVLGLNSSAVRLISEESSLHGPAGARNITRIMLKIAGLAAGCAIPLCWCCMWLGVRYLGFPLPADPWLLLLFSLAVALFGIQLVVADCFYGHHEVGYAPLFTGGLMAGPITTLLFLALFVGIAWSEGRAGGEGLYEKQFAGVTVFLHKASVFKTLSILVGSLCVSLPIASWLLYRTMKHLPKVPEKQSKRFNVAQLTRVSLSLLGLSIAAYFLTVFVDVAIAGKVFGQGTIDFDMYSAARRLMFMAFITPQLAGSLVSPGVAKSYFHGGNKQELQALLKKYALLGALPAFLIAVVLLLFPGQLLGTYLGDKFAAAASTSRILAIAPLFAAWSGLGGYALAVTGFQRYCIAVNVIAGLFVLFAGYPAALYAQSHGLAWVCVAGFTLKHAAEWIITRKLLGVWTHVG